MKLLGIDYIVFEDSYLLGWNISNDRIDLYCELLLTEKHPEFEPFDKKKNIRLLQDRKGRNFRFYAT